MQVQAATNPLFARSLSTVQSSAYDNKRQHLALLPSPQIIEICLLFELHVPLYVKNWVWPGHLQTSGPPPPPPPPGEDAGKIGENMEAAKGDDGDDGSDTSSDTDTAPTAEPKPPEDGADASASTATAAPIPGPPVRPPPMSVPVVGYPHQPYGYQTYPHASYYPHLWAPYPHMPYAMPAPPSTAYHPAPPPAYHPAPTFSAAPPPQPAPPAVHVEPGPPPTLQDDMPSYEDMISEALTEHNDPDGVAPKDIYTWMQTHYPVQSNFRPSASQALQKAYKRGRFEKLNNGRYRLNQNYTSTASASRKPTRRPQTIVTQPSTNGHIPRASPFTNAPLNRISKPAFGGHTPFVPPPYGVIPPPPPPPPPTEESSEDAYAAAQHILKTINFGEGLISLEPESKEVEKNNIRAQLQAHLALLAAQLQEYSQERETEAAALEADRIHRNRPIMAPIPVVPPATITIPVASTPSAQPPPIAIMEVEEHDKDDDEDDDMDEVIIP